jgi:hypothetical protein
MELQAHDLHEWCFRVKGREAGRKVWWGISCLRRLLGRKAQEHGCPGPWACSQIVSGCRWVHAANQPCPSLITHRLTGGPTKVVHLTKISPTTLQISGFPHAELHADLPSWRQKRTKLPLFSTVGLEMPPFSSLCFTPVLLSGTRFHSYCEHVQLQEILVSFSIVTIL